MKKINLIQTGLWLSFLVYYCASKFFAGYQGYSHAYLIQVVIIVLLTALLPYYLSKGLLKLERAKAAIIALAPSLLAMAGYAGFFFVFIKPNYPSMAAEQVIVRGLLPGVVISLILALPLIYALWIHRAEEAAEGR